jgi:predicted dehydrogenase
MKFLIAGLGSIGRRHLNNLLALGERDILLLRSGRSTLPDQALDTYPVETDLAAALSQRPDAVIISNPTSIHLDVAIPAAEAGCHLLLEKPISHTMDRVNDLGEAVQRGGGQVLVGFQFRFHPGLQKISSLLSESAIGRPLSFRVHWGEWLPGWHPWEDYRRGFSARADLGGGVILTLSHPLDYLRWLFGEVEALWAFAGRLGDLDLDVEDTAEIGLKFARGVFGSVHLDYNQRPPAHTLEIIGMHGVIRWDNADGVVRVVKAVDERKDLTPRPLSLQGKGESYPLPAGFERNDLFLDEMRHFLDVCRGETRPLCTLKDGVEALRLALAARTSAEEGKLVII